MARRATIIIEASTGSAKKNLASLEDGLNDVDVAAVEAGEGFERMSDDAASSAATVQSATNQATTALQQQSTAASTVAQSQTSLRKTTSSTASQLTTDLVQASQDAAFGFENLAASAPFVAEQFGRLQRQAGGTAGALGAIGTSLTNPVTGVIFRQWHRQNGECFWCGDPCGSSPSDAKYHIDHLTPVSRHEADPTNFPRNLVIACSECNYAKHNRLPIEFKHYRLQNGKEQTYARGVSL